jgi:hypothetical protein
MEHGRTGEVLQGLRRFEAQHPEWTEDEGGEDGWEPNVAWWAIDSPDGLILVDPLVVDWTALDELVDGRGGCAGIVRTCHWHQRSVAEAAGRYGAGVWAMPPPPGAPRHAFDHPAADGGELVGGLRSFVMERADEIALCLPAQAALAFGDVMLRNAAGELRMCPESWTHPEGGRPRLRELLGGLTKLPVEHVLVSHGPLVLGDGSGALLAALR